MGDISSNTFGRVWRFLTNGIGRQARVGRTAPKPTTRLTMEKLEAREQASVTPIHAAVIAKSLHEAVVQHTRTFTSPQIVVQQAAASPAPFAHRNLGVNPATVAALKPAHVDADATVKRSVTFLPPTARDRAITGVLANRKWQYVANVVNPFTGGTLRITAEIVFVRTGTFSIVQVGVAQGYFGPVRYYSGSSGIWRVQNNGYLVLRHDHPYPAQYWSKYQFMHITSINATRFVAVGAGTWRHIPLNATSIR